MIGNCKINQEGDVMDDGTKGTAPYAGLKLKNISDRIHDSRTAGTPNLIVWHAKNACIGYLDYARKNIVGANMISVGRDLISLLQSLVAEKIEHTEKNIDISYLHSQAVSMVRYLTEELIDLEKKVTKELEGRPSCIKIERVVLWRGTLNNGNVLDFDTRGKAIEFLNNN